MCVCVRACACVDDACCGLKYVVSVLSVIMHTEGIGHRMTA